MDRLVSLEPSNVVTIRVEPGQRCYGELTLRNVMYTMPVAFRIQPMNRARYSIRPQSGIIHPLATQSVEITYHLPPNSLLPDSFPHSDDSFLLHSVVAPAAAAMDPSSTLDAVPSDWFAAKKKQVFIDSGIKIIFVGSSVLARLVVDGLMDELREVLDRSDPAWRAVDSSDSAGQTLLHLAIARGRADLVQLLLEFVPNLEARGGARRTPLEAAAAAGEALIAEILLSRRASSDRSATSPCGPIHLAAAKGHHEVLRLLLLEGAHADAPTDDGRTALHLAVDKRRLECAQMLLEAGCKVNVRGGTDGNTALHVASSAGDKAMVDLLLEKGANKEIRNKMGTTAYDVAAERGHAHLYDALKLGDSLSAAARKGDVADIDRLIDGGASVNGRDQHGWTALMRAGFKGRVEVMRALLEKGAEVEARDREGYTALHCAVEAGRCEAVEVLIERGADLEARTAKGATAMQIAGWLGYAGIARVLAQGGAVTDAGAGGGTLVIDRAVLSSTVAEGLGISGAGRERLMSERKDKKGNRTARRGVAGGLPKAAAVVASH